MYMGKGSLITLSIIIFFSFILGGCSGCFKKHNAYIDPETKTPEQIENLLKEYLKVRYNHEVTIEFVEKEQMQRCGGSFDGCICAYDIKDAYTHHYSIVDEDGLKANISYSDAYYVDGRYYQYYISEGYGDTRAAFDERVVYRTSLEKTVKESFKNYKFIYNKEDKQNHIYYIFIYATKYEEVLKLIKGLDSFGQSIKSNNSEFYLYVVKDKKLYDSINYNNIASFPTNNSNTTNILSEVTKKNATKITYRMTPLLTEELKVAYNRGKKENLYDISAEEIFNKNGDKNDELYQNPNNFKYTIFVYSGEYRNSFWSYVSVIGLN